MTMLRMGSNSSPSDTRSPEVTVTPVSSAQHPQPEPSPPQPPSPPPIPPQPEEIPNVLRRWRTQNPPPPSLDKLIVEAINVVERAASARIAYHQSEIDALQQALAPFRVMAQNSAGPMGSSDQKAVDALLAIARDLVPLGKDPLGTP